MLVGMNHVTDDNYLALQVGILCALLFLIAVAAIAKHPAWFG